MKPLIFSVFLFFTAHTAFAESKPNNPPPQITRASYLSWLRAINSNVSAFSDHMFDWYDEQLRNPLPAQVAADPDKIYVSVERPLAETIELEQSGDIEEGNTLGFEAYAIIDAPVKTALETKLFGWGKPVGQREGETWPFDTVFSHHHNWISEKWGPGNYYSGTDQTGGGLVKDLHDDYTVLIRGNETDGYIVLAGFFAVSGANSPSTSHISIVMLKPLPNGKTELRQNVRQQGQSYKIFGLEYGRRNFGFNLPRVRQGEKAFISTIMELKNTGTIKENKPKKEGELPN